MATRSATKIPHSETEFLSWASQFVNQLTNHSALYFLEEQRLQTLQSGLTEFENAMTDAVAARDAALAATRHKNDIRETFEDEVRVAVRMIQANNLVTDASRDAAGVHVHKSTRTPVTPPATAPVGFVIASDRLEHTLSFSDSATPTRRARPAGVTGCEVYLFVGDDTPQSPSRYTFRMLSTRTPQRVAFTDAEAGKTANYLLRWVNTKGETGPWSQIISATIPAV